MRAVGLLDAEARPIGPPALRRASSKLTTAPHCPRPKSISLLTLVSQNKALRPARLIIIEEQAMAMTRTLVYLGVLLFANPTFAYDRLGRDIAGAAVSDATACASNCDSNPNCKAWTWVRRPLKNPASAMCYLKNTVPPPSRNNVCKTDLDCLSGVKDGRGQWCGETPARTVANSGNSILGQNVVVNCRSGRVCGPIEHPRTHIQSTDYFCQSP